MTAESEYEKEVLLNLLISVTYRSRPVRWRLRRSLEQEKSKLERFKHEAEDVLKRYDGNEIAAEQDEIYLTNVQTHISDNENFIRDLNLLIELLRPTVFQPKEGIEELKARNDKFMKVVRKIYTAEEKEKKLNQNLL